MRDTKGKEYASSEDRFDNFNRLAKTLDINRLKIASVYLQKHLDAINTFIKEGKISSTEPIRGRFVDAVTYLILMAGMESETTLGLKDTYAYNLINYCPPGSPQCRYTTSPHTVCCPEVSSGRI